MADKCGTFSKLWWSADNTNYTAIEFLEGSSIGLQQEFTDTNGLRGTRQHSAGRVRETARRVAGSLLFAPSASELDFLAVWGLGGAKSGNDIPLGEGVPDRTLKTSRDGVRDTYTGCKAGRMVFSCSEGSVLQVAVDVVGTDEGDGGTEPTAAIADDGGPYVMSDCVLTLGGTQYPFKSFEVSVDNGLQVEQRNSVTPSAIYAADLTVGVSLSLPLGDASAAYSSGISGAAVSAAFTNGNRSVTFTLPCVQTPKGPKDLAGRRVLNFPWVGVARRTGNSPPLTIANDVTG